MGVYHHVEKTQAGYQLSHERAAWRSWHNGDQNFVARPGDKVIDGRVDHSDFLIGS